MSLLQTAAVLGSLAATVAAHGHVTGIVVAGTYYTGYDPSFQYANPAPVVIGWSDPEDLGNGFIPPSNYSTPDIICHLGATPGGTSAKIAAGETVELQWSPWPDSHHGPVIDYLAPVSGDFADVDKTTLEFFKIDEVGLVDETTVPGTWGSDQLIANNNSWVVTIPKSIKPGNYVLRHEIIALHSAGQADGAQNYPQCINLVVTGSGTDAPTGTLGEKLYTNTAAPGVLVNIYQSLSTYEIPGPTLYSGAVSVSQTAVAATGTAAASTGASSAYEASTTAAASSAEATSSAAAPATTSNAAPSSTAAATSVTSQQQVASSASTASPETTSAPAPAPASYGGASETTAAAETTSYSAPVETYSAPAETSATSVAPISAIASAIPSSALTQTIPTTLPTATGGAASPTGGYSGGGWGSGSGNSSFGGVPSKPLPAGFTLQDLLEWLEYLLKKSEGSGRHQRDFRGAH